MSREQRNPSPPPTHSSSSRRNERPSASTSQSYDSKSGNDRRANSSRRSRSRSPAARRSRFDSNDQAPRARDNGGRRDDRPRDDQRGGGGARNDTRRRDEPPHGGPPGGDGGWGRTSPGRPSLALPSQSSLTTGAHAPSDEPAKVAVIEPNFAPSGALAAETNTFQGVVLKYNEPPEARKPVRPWRLYVFKGREQVELFHVHRQSAYLMGRDRIVADIPIDHPSTSKQHAVLQYRQAIEKNEFGDSKTMTKPFLIDLDSANGTLVNDTKIPPSRFYELKSGDVIKFAFSSREYVLLAET